MNKYERKLKAEEHVKHMEKELSNEIIKCVESSKIYGENEFDDYTPRGNYNTKVILAGLDTTTALFKLNKTDSVALLNFASYKNPGGRFLDGSIAQEEAICHESALYNILSNERFYREFYTPNKKRLNKGLYHSNMIYTPKVPFIRDNKILKCDVITCAAPNKRVATGYQRLSEEYVNNAMKHRIRSVLSSANVNSIDYLILGAFGCGVFRNNPSGVSSIFRELLAGEFSGAFKCVIFAIPNKDSRNYREFKKVLSGK